MTPDPRPGPYEAIQSHPDVLTFAEAERLLPGRFILTRWRYFGEGEMHLDVAVLDDRGRLQADPNDDDEIWTETLVHQATTDIPPAVFGFPEGIYP